MASISSCVPPEAASLPVFDSKGESHAFSSLYTSNNDQEQTLIIFIRHYFCGSCKQYISALSEDGGVSPVELAESRKRLIIIGCGHPDVIDQYAKDTKCPFPIYTDPTRQLHDTLGLRRTLSLGDKKPDYIKSSFMSNIVKSAMSQLSAGSCMFKGGDIHQVGGEYLIDAQGHVLWSHAMENTRDHVEVAELRKLLGLS